MRRRLMYGLAGSLLGGLLLVGLVVVRPGLAAGPPPPAPPPPTLSGEQFMGTPTNTGTCTPGSPSTITFTVSGVAKGPYPGPFTESGSAILMGEPTTQGTFIPILGFSASFTINSSVGQVTGSKTLASPPFSNGNPDEGLCVDYTSPNFSYYDHDFEADAAYQATITTAAGVFSDQGQSPVTNNHTFESGTCPGCNLDDANFGDLFTSLLTQPIPVDPASKQDCMNGGYAQFGYKNEGQCIKYVEDHSH